MNNLLPISLKSIFRKRINIVFTIVTILLFFMSCKPNTEVIKTTEINPSSRNSYYWEYKGKALILLGGSDEDNLFQWERAELEKHLDLLASIKGNFIRNTMSCRNGGNEYPYKRLENGLFDLEQWNPEYWEKLKVLLDLAYERDIIIQIELWNPHDWFFKREGQDQGGWINRAFNPENNINYTVEETGLPVIIDYSAIKEGANDHAFFHAPFAEDMAVVRKYQEKFIKKVLETSLPYPNVLYCINNESYLDIRWSVYWLDYVRKTALELQEPVYVTDMRLVPTTDIVKKNGFDYIEISQSASELFRPKGSGVGEGHFETIKNLVENLKDSPVPFNSVKQYGTIRLEKWSNEGIERVWRSIFGGQAGVRFHRPPSGLGLSERAQKNIKSLRIITDLFDLANVKPHQNLEHLFLKRESNSAFLMGEEGKVLAVFFTSTGNEVDVNISSFAGEVSVRWINTNTAEWEKTENFAADTITLKKPGKNQWTALIEVESI